jgi:predicted tellurium resistance membrane protein TerC
VELVIILGAIVVAIVVLGWVFKLIRNTLQTVLLVAFLLLALYFLFGIGPGAIWEQIQNWLGRGINSR